MRDNYIMEKVKTHRSVRGGVTDIQGWWTVLKSGDLTRDSGRLVHGQFQNKRALLELRGLKQKDLPYPPLTHLQMDG